MAKNTTYTVVQGPLEHDGKSYGSGEFVELDPKLGDALADQGVLAKGKVDAPAPGSEGTGEAQA
jgi:hypothetical protein